MSEKEHILERIKSLPEESLKEVIDFIEFLEAKRMRTVGEEKMKGKIEVEEEEIFNPSDYRGIYKGLRINLNEEIKGLREEWTRDI